MEAKHKDKRNIQAHGIVSSCFQILAIFGLIYGFVIIENPEGLLGPSGQHLREQVQEQVKEEEAV